MADVDRLIEIAERQPGVFGARMTGGGFGGSVVIAAPSGSSADVAAAIRDEYARITGRTASILVPVDQVNR